VSRERRPEDLASESTELDDVVDLTAGPRHGREQPTGGDRDDAAVVRDRIAELHDDAAEARDGRADARDERADAREASAPPVDAGAAEDRAGSKRDRLDGAQDRRRAAGDRESAGSDRAASARERASFLVDELTGARRREAGMMELDREITQSKRTGQPFVLAFVDVDDLKGTNDSSGHQAGDELLRRVADAIRGRIRSYDLLVRYGGDEFLCGLLGLTISEVLERFALVNSDLAARHAASVSVGVAEVEPDDELQDVVKRADDAMYQRRAGNTRDTA
jgi:diguanylate cyclase (GGDEF)-like protein